jgi:hypothetical protein
MLLTLLQVPSAAAQCSPYDGNPPLEEEEEKICSKAGHQLNFNLIFIPSAPHSKIEIKKKRREWYMNCYSNFLYHFYNIDKKIDN